MWPCLWPRPDLACDLNSGLLLCIGDDGASWLLAIMPWWLLPHRTPRGCELVQWPTDRVLSRGGVSVTFRDSSVPGNVFLGKWFSGKRSKNFRVIGIDKLTTVNNFYLYQSLCDQCFQAYRCIEKNFALSQTALNIHIVIKPKFRPVMYMKEWMYNVMQVIQSLPVSDACDVWSYGVVRAWYILYTFTSSCDWIAVLMMMAK